MKIPSLLRIPNHKKFQFAPRFYDPVKEDIENRTSLIEQELKEDGQVAKDDYESQAFRLRMRNNLNRRGQQDKKSFLIQALIAAILFLLVFIVLY